MKAIRHVGVTACLLFFLFASDIAFCGEFIPEVPLIEEDPLTSFLDELQGNNVVRLPFYFERPLRQDQLGKILFWLDSSGLNTKAFSFYKKEKAKKAWLDYSFPEGRIRARIRLHEKILFNRGDHFSDRDSSNRDLLYSTLGLEVSGNFHSKLSFFLDVRNMLIKGEKDEKENFIPSSGLPVLEDNGKKFSDQFEAGLSFKSRYGHFFYGRRRIEWGPGRFNQLMFSSSAQPINMIQFSKQLGFLRLNSFSGYLHSDRLSKKVHGHRLDFLFKNWRLGISESVIYGQRDMEFLYIFPLTPYHFAEHHLGDLDNNNIGIDWEWNHKQGRSYFELFFDDYSLLENPFSFPAAKWAATIGWQKQFLRKGFGGGIEYSRIEPYLFAHRIKANEYTNYNFNLGSQLGADADQLSLDFNWKPGFYKNSFRLSTVFQYTRKGLNNTLDSSYKNVDKKEFLRAPRITTFQPTLKIEFFPHYAIFCSAQTGLSFIHNEALSSRGKDQFYQFNFLYRWP